MADFDTLKANVIADWRAQAEWRSGALDDYGFIAGHQWTDTEKAEMEETSRAPIVFNRVAVIIASVSGSEINNRTEVRFLPRTMGDVKPNEILSQGAEWFRDQANAEDEESEAFEDALVCGLGWTETSLNFEDDPEGEPRVTRIDPLEMAWDCHAHRKGLQDMQRVHRVRDIPLSEARDMFPGVRDEDLSADWVEGNDDDETPHHTVIGDQYSEGDGEVGEKPRDTVRIVQTQWCERERVVQFAMPGADKPQEMTPAAWERIKGRVVVDGIPHRTMSRKVWRQAFLGRDSILKENQPCPKASTFQAVTGHYDRKDKRFYGILRSMKDPQKFANKWLSQTLHIINTNAKGGVMVEADAVDDIRDFEDNWAASDAVHVMKPGAIAGGKIQEKSGPQFPAALMNLTEFAVSSIRDASGVNMELLGLRDANQPGVLEYQRRQSAMTTLAGFFDALRYYRKTQGKVMLHYLRAYIAPTGRLVRVVEDDLVRYVPLAMADDTAEYDVIVDDAPQAPNQKERNWEILQTMLPIFADKLDGDDWAMIAEYSPLPTALIERLKQKAAEAKKQPDPQQQLMMAQAQADIAKTQSEAEENKADAAKKIAEIRQMGAGDMSGVQAQQKMQLEAAKFQQNAAQDRARFEMDIVQDQQKHQQTMALQRMRAAQQGMASRDGSR